MITDSNQVCFVRMTGRKVQEVIHDQTPLIAPEMEGWSG
jgi:hypothetical protein